MESGAFQQGTIVTVADIVTPAKGEPNDDKMLLKSCVTGVKAAKKRLASPDKGAAYRNPNQP